VKTRPGGRVYGLLLIGQIPAAVLARILRINQFRKLAEPDSSDDVYCERHSSTIRVDSHGGADEHLLFPLLSIMLSREVFVSLQSLSSWLIFPFSDSFTSSTHPFISQERRRSTHRILVYHGWWSFPSLLPFSASLLTFFLFSPPSLRLGFTSFTKCLVTQPCHQRKAISFPLYIGVILPSYKITQIPCPQ